MLPGMRDDDDVVLARFPHAPVRARWIHARTPSQVRTHACTGPTHTHRAHARMHRAHACLLAPGPHAHSLARPSTLAPGPHTRLVSMHACTRSPCPLARGVPMQACTGPCMHAHIGPCTHAHTRPPHPLGLYACTHQAHARMLAPGPHACSHVGSPCMHAPGPCTLTLAPMPARLWGPHACAPDPCTRACCIPCCM
jgi:hypothetical protein